MKLFQQKVYDKDTFSFKMEYKRVGVGPGGGVGGLECKIFTMPQV